jgi:LemA protein
MDTLSYVILVIAVIILFWIILTYNGLIKLRNRTKEASSDIDVQLKRRHDLIPNLVETVKGYASHERELFEKVTEARAKAIGAQGMKERAAAEDSLSGTLKSLFAVAENYPDLKASVNFLELQKELSDTENKIQAARRFYNTNVMELNTRIESFPVNIIASVFSFRQMELFQAAEEEKGPVKVSF